MVDSAIFIASGTIYIIPALLMAMWLWGDTATRSVAVKAVLVVSLALAFNELLGFFWFHPRPFALKIGQSLVKHALDSSFPSDHMTVFAGIGLTLLYGGAARLGLAMLATGVSVGWARIFLGIHFPLDMAGAMGVVILSYAFVTPIWRKAEGQAIRFGERVYGKLLYRFIAAGWIKP